MKVIIQPKPKTYELTKAQVARLKEIAHGRNPYSTSDDEPLDELEKMGLVTAQFGGGGDERYRMTEAGTQVFQELNSSQRMPD